MHGRLTDWGKRVYGRRQETVERSFADAKQLHGHRYARMRGWLRVSEQCLLAAAAQNITKIALLRARFHRCVHACARSWNARHHLDGRWNVRTLQLLAARRALLA